MRPILFVLFFVLFESFQIENEAIPIYIEEYGVDIESIGKLGDTVRYNKSDIEDFKFVFYDNRGKCYCEHFVKGQLFEKGYYENSLDTLKKYVTSRFSDGTTTPITVRRYFQPLKNGEWITYKEKNRQVERFKMGILDIKAKDTLK